MFGSLAAFADGQDVHGRARQRRHDEDRQLALSAGSNLFEVMPGKPMREYVTVPDWRANQARARACRAVNELRAEPAAQGSKTHGETGARHSPGASRNWRVQLVYGQISSGQWSRRSRVERVARLAVVDDLSVGIPDDQPEPVIGGRRAAVLDRQSEGVVRIF